MLDYLDLNRFDEVYKGPGDSFFGSLEVSRPEILPIYWSQAQMQARQDGEIAEVQSFLNRLWRFDSEGRRGLIRTSALFIQSVFAAYRTEVEEYTMDNITKCSVFHTFQGWTALSDMLPDQGLLHVVPIPEAMAYVLPITERWHPLLMHVLTSIPAREAGDSVWWHWM